MADSRSATTVLAFLFAAAMIPSAVFRADAVWVVAEIFNGLMILPNVTALLLLNDEVTQITHIKTAA